MKKNIKDIPLNAATLGGKDITDFHLRVSSRINNGQVLRIYNPYTTNFIIGLCGTIGLRNGFFFFSGYGDGTKIRSQGWWLTKIDGISAYVNGESESNAVYIKCNIGSGQTLGISIMSASAGIPSMTIVESVPTDAVEITSVIRQ